MSCHNAQTPEDVPGGELVIVQTADEARQEEIAECAASLLNIALVSEGRGQVYCLMCHTRSERGSHLPGCAVEALEVWFEHRVA
jgi:hypothetical protein